ncbi:outer membrane beta-barrel protein [Mucilaginibacter gotjawali]|uniref:Uncharacterized protein n=2 Tax=Mucilaginibacter gotjawali TaxID=1550579 RepID=A0A839SRX2_9SPHI|nr:outer membrane beta-barrel protein [Mucilaginibacter gotjawali]MBB3059107.1 hypothetical protein [Mucilaginibacter gotjawali]BAU52821.1 hypothetical protein MgSA37_00984 [Mucilaginibacter gotjawali]
MKKILLLIFLSAAMQQLFAQTLKFGIKAGWNESTADLGTTTSTVSSYSGFKGGVFGDFGFNKIVIETGVFFTTYGYNTSTTFTETQPQPIVVTLKGQATYNYLQIPVDVLYRTPFGPVKVFFGGGPYYGLAISGGRRLITISDGAVTAYRSSKIDFGNPDDFSRTDLGLNALAGVSLHNGLLFSVDYGLGLKNIYSGNNSEVKNRALSLSVGYAFL